MVRAPLVCLTGVGGVGKTRLALLVAWRARRAFDDVRLVDVTQPPGDRSLAWRIASTFGIAHRSVRQAVDGLVDHFAGRSALLVLDNCDPIVDEVCEVSHVLLRSCPRLRILVTSREALRVAGEAALTVPPLALPDARPVPVGELAEVASVALFLQRMRAGGAAFQLTADNESEVRELCRRLDGLPLAIELATALFARGILGITEPLPDLSSWVSTPVPGPEPRHESLHSCFRWSHQLCAPAERLLWARLTVFEDAWDVDAAQAVCTGGSLAEESLLDVLAALVDKSVLVRDERGDLAQYRLLGAVRAFGAEQLRDLGQHHAMRRRHRNWCRQLVADAAAQWAGPTQGDWLARLDRHVPDIRSALEFSLSRPDGAAAALEMADALSRYWLVRGRFAEGRRWFDRVLAGGTEPPLARARAQLAAAVLATGQGDLDGARALAGRARCGVSDGCEGLAAVGEEAAGLISLLNENPVRAAGHFHRAADLHRAREDSTRQAEATTRAAVAGALAGDLRAVLAAYELTRTLVERPQQTSVTSTFLAESSWAVGLAQRRHGAGPQALTAARDGLRMEHGLCHVPGIARCLELLAWIAADEGQAHRSAVLLGAVTGLTRRAAIPPLAVPGLRPDHERCMDDVRRALGEAAFGAAFRTGETLDMADAVRLVLDEPAGARPRMRPQARASAARCDPAHAPLTRREREVAELIGQGLTNREIGTRLVIAQRTAESHVESIMAKLGVTSRTRVALWLAQHDSWSESGSRPARG